MAVPDYAFDDDDDDNDNMALTATSAGGKLGVDSTTADDFDYADADELEGSNAIIASLTKEEQESFPDEFMALRHYRAEKGDVTKAIASIKGTIAWRAEFGVTKVVDCCNQKAGQGNPEMAAIIQKENDTGKMYVRGYDISGRAILYMRPVNENTNDEDNNMKHLVFQLEKAIACSFQNKKAKICLIIDYEGFKLRHSPPMSTSRRTLNILQKHYPERLFRIYLCNPPFIFRSFWAVIKPFVDPVTKKKVCFCSGKQGMAQIRDDMGGENSIGAKHLEPCAGGTDTLRDFDSTEYLALPFHVAFDETPTTTEVKKK